jgi:8-oxo-dGTP pyrophosphatase MutT (NUDIX family)
VAPGAKEGDVVLVFYCTTKQDALLMEPEKFSEWRWVSLKEYEEIYISFNPEVREMIINYLTKLQ